MIGADMSNELTQRTLNAAKPRDREYFLWDASLPGFGVRITPNGSKTFVVRKRLGPGRPQIKKSLGKYQAPLTLSMARKKAREILSEIALGRDPEHLRMSDTTTVEAFADHFLEQTLLRKKPATDAYHRTMLSRHIIPLIGSVRVSQLTSRQITQMVIDIAAGKTAKSVKTKPRGKARIKGGTIVANRALAVLSVMLSHAVDMNLRRDNPAAGIKKYKEGKRERFLSGEELQRLGQALLRAEERGVNTYGIAAIRVLALSGARKSEVLSLKWSYLNREGGYAALPDSKTGSRPLMLSPQVIEILDALPRRPGNDWVFPSLTSDGHFVGLQKIWDNLRKDANISDVRLHDLRHTFASVAVSEGYSLYIVGKALGHARSSTTQRYAHLANDPVAGAIDQTSQQIAQKLSLT